MSLNQSDKKRRLKIWMPKGTDRAINISILVLAVVGLLMISSASMGIAIDSDHVNNPLYLPMTVIKQVVFLCAGYISMTYLARKFTFSFFTSSWFSTWVLIIAGALFFCIFFTAGGGSKAWIRIPLPGVEMSIQPAEFAKIMAILIVAAYLGDVTKMFNNPNDIWKRPLILIMTYVLIVLILQKDFGSAAVIATISGICVLIPSHPQLKKCQKVICILFLGLAVLGLYLLSPYGTALIKHLPLQPYQINRILSAVNPFIDQYNTGYQLVNGLVSFATGGWFGLGYGNSVRKYTRFPAANTDFILAIVVEELGIFGFLLIFVPYMIIIVRLFLYAFKMKSEKGKIILIGVAMYIAIHTLLNVGGVTGLIPLTGVPLLMISSGGSSTLSVMCAVGIAQAVIMRFNKGEIK